MATTRRLSRQRSGKNDRRTAASAFAQLIAVSAIARIKQLTPNADLAFLPLDQADLESVRAAPELASKEASVDALRRDDDATYANPARLRASVGRQPSGLLRANFLAPA